jgi:hypothetical protein
VSGIAVAFLLVTATYLGAQRRLRYFAPMNWRPGKPPGDTADSYEIYDELYTPDGRRVAILECFTSNPDVYYCNALTPAGKQVRLGAGSNYDTTRDWAERVTGLKVDRDLNGRRKKIKCRPRRVSDD